MQLSQEIEKPIRMKRLNVVSLKMLPYHSNIIRSPQDIYNLAKEMLLPDEDREHCVVLALSTKNHVTAIHTCPLEI
jgi:DNA repair protein RadC